jgi:hypothetical protein
MMMRLAIAATVAGLASASSTNMNGEYKLSKTPNVRAPRFILKHTRAASPWQ